jgi:uncharacterized protein HemX
VGENFLLRSFAENLHQAPGVTEGVDRLATSGPLGLGLVVVTLSLVWAIRELLKAKDQAKADAKDNTTEMLKLADKSNTVIVQLTQELTTTRETLKNVSEKLEETTQALTEANEIMRTLKEQRMRR